MTQFSRALAELNIEIICAKSSPGQGSRGACQPYAAGPALERTARSSIDAGNAFLPGFVGRFNERFAVQPAKTVDLHQALRLRPGRLDDVLCHREQRHVGDQLTLAYGRRQLILERSVVSEELGGQYVDLYDFADGRLEVRWKGQMLPYRVLDKDQRVNPAAIVENKRLGHALSLIKARQD